MNSESTIRSMSEDLGTEEEVNEVDQVNSDMPTKEGTSQTIQDCRTISLTSHASKVMQASEQDGVQLIRSSIAET